MTPAEPNPPDLEALRAKVDDGLTGMRNPPTRAETRALLDYTEACVAVLQGIEWVPQQYQGAYLDECPSCLGDRREGPPGDRLDKPTQMCYNVFTHKEVVPRESTSGTVAEPVRRSDMAQGTLPAPGTKYGPCLEPCAHRDCAASRNESTEPCRLCGEPIGYERGFYREYVPEHGEAEHVHAICAEKLEPNIARIG